MPFNLRSHYLYMDSSAQPPLPPPPPALSLSPAITDFSTVAGGFLAAIPPPQSSNWLSSYFITAWQAAVHLDSFWDFLFPSFFFSFTETSNTQQQQKNYIPIKRQIWKQGSGKVVADLPKM